MMGNSAKDPLWQAKISSEIYRNPGLKTVIEDKCSRCHMGIARYQAITDGTPVGVLFPGFLDSNHALNPAAMDGVSCTLCHQIQAENLGTDGSFTGLYEIDTTTEPPYRLAFGPYTGPFQNPMEMNSGFSPTPGSQAADSALCGSCNTLYTPSVDAGGNVISEFPEQTTYLEWEHSSIANETSCQDCHLPKAVGSVVISNRPMWLSPRNPFGEHQFVGGNSFMVNLLKANAADGSIVGSDADSNAADYEPHYDVITSPDEVQIYEPVMLDSDAAVTYTLLRAYTYSKDNRLLPAAFDKATTPVDIAVMGLAALDENFTPGRDRITYQIDVSVVSGKSKPLSVTAELLYQAVSYPFAKDLGQGGTNLTDRFLGVYELADKAPKWVAGVQIQVR